MEIFMNTQTGRSWHAFDLALCGCMTVWVDPHNRQRPYPNLFVQFVNYCQIYVILCRPTKVNTRYNQGTCGIAACVLLYETYIPIIIRLYIHRARHVMGIWIYLSMYLSKRFLLRLKVLYCPGIFQPVRNTSNVYYWMYMRQNSVVYDLQSKFQLRHLRNVIYLKQDAIWSCISN